MGLHPVLKMVFYTPEMQARDISFFSQMLSPQQGRELKRVGHFLCDLIERQIDGTRLARELYDEIFPKILPTVSPLPPAPGNNLAVEYFYGKCLMMMTEIDSARREEYWNQAVRMEQQVCDQARQISTSTISNICNFSLKSATVHYFIAASNFLYPQSPEKACRTAIKFHSRQALVRYNRLNNFFEWFDAVPPVTPAVEGYGWELRQAESEGKAEYRKKIKELNQRDPEYIKVLKAQRRISADIAITLPGYLPHQSRFKFVKDHFKSVKELKRQDPQFRTLQTEVYNRFLVGKEQRILHQEVLLGLMRCYALQGKYSEIMKTADRLKEVLDRPEALPLESIAVSAQRIEYGAKENQTQRGKCRPFVPNCPESVVQSIEQMISSFETASRIVMKSLYFGEQEIGRIVNWAA